MEGSHRVSSIVGHYPRVKGLELYAGYDLAKLEKSYCGKLLPLRCIIIALQFYYDHANLYIFLLQKKRDAKNKTGRRGGRSMEYTGADLVILEIIGLDSPVLEGLPVPEASGTNREELVEPPAATAAPPRPPSPPVTGGAQPNFNCRRQRGRRFIAANDEEESELKRKKLMLQVEGIELENHKRALELLDLERKLELEPSHRIQAFMDAHYNNSII